MKQPVHLTIMEVVVKKRIELNKMYKGYRRYTFFCVFLFVSIYGYGQDCVSSLDLAKASFQGGKLYDIPQILESCIEDGFSTEQKVEAFELLSLVYLYIDEPEKAEESYLNLLKADPEWAPDSASEVEIDYLSKKFKTTPIFTLYPIKLGVNYSFVKVININGVDNPATTKQSYTQKFGFQVGTGVDWNIFKNISLGGEVLFTTKNYQYHNNLFANPPGSTLQETPGDSLVIDFTNNGFEVPVFVRYTHKFKKWYPFAYLGYMFSYTFSFNGKPAYFDINVKGTDQTVNPDVGRILNLNPIRNSFNHSILGGLGIKYRLKYEYFLFEVRYALGLKNVLNANDQFNFGSGDTQNDIRAYSYRYAQVDDDFRIDNVYINLGFVHPLYKPRKIEKKRRKSRNRSVEEIEE